jgi:drug/metabolite transporter (DMT)-like permease
MVLWGSAFPASRWAVGQVPHSVAAALRFAGGSFLLLALCAVVPATRRTTRRDLATACAAGLIGVCAYNVLFFWGVSLAPASDGSVVFPALTPVFTAVVLMSTGRERARPARLAGLGLGLAGAVAFCLASGAAANSTDRLIGNAVLAAAAAVWTAYTLLNRTLVASVDPLRAVTAATCAGSAALALLAVPDLGEVPWNHLSGDFWADIAYLAIGPTSISYVLFTCGVRDTGAGTASVMMFAVPVFGTAFSFLLLDESFTAPQAVTSFVMLAGAYLAVTSTGEAGRAAPSPTTPGPGGRSGQQSWADPVPPRRPGAGAPVPVLTAGTIPSHGGEA